jgi:UDP-glucuronate decarboxylase
MRDPMHVLVAGGAGFVGSHLCDALVAKGYHVTCIDNFHTGQLRNVSELNRIPHFRILDADVAECEDVPGTFDQIYNLASPASPAHYQADPVRTLMTNVVGSERLLSLAERHGARLLQASTSEVYGSPEMHPQKEDYWGHVNCTGTRACYDEGKRAAEALCFDFQRTGRADVRVARIFNTYGPRMRVDDGRIVSNLIVQALLGRPLTIYGDGKQTRSFCYVSDLVSGLVALMERAVPPPGPVNLGNPQEVTILELACELRRIVPTSAPLVHLPLPQDDPHRRRPDIGRAKALLDWSPTVPLPEGLRRTADAISSELGHLRVNGTSPAAAAFGAVV